VRCCVVELWPNCEAVTLLTLATHALDTCLHRHRPLCEARERLARHIRIYSDSISTSSDSNDTVPNLLSFAREIVRKSDSLHKVSSVRNSTKV